jgi:hypothetical protein
MTLYEELEEAKRAEDAAIAKRREIEDAIIAAVGANADEEGTRTVYDGPWKIKVVGRINRRVDSDKVVRIADECGLQGALDELFRWKAELNLSNWTSADAETRLAFAEAITAVPGRPAVTVERKETKE